MRIKHMSLPIAALLFLPSIGFAAYRIQLKNGNAFITSEYRQSETALQCYIPGGLVAIPNSQIQSIEESDAPYVDGAIPRYGKPRPDERAGVATAAGVGEAQAAPAMDELDVRGPFSLGDYVRENQGLKGRLSAALSQVRECTRNKDPEGKKNAQMAARKISRSIYALTDEFKKRNGGELPDGWWEDPVQE